MTGEAVIDTSVLVDAIVEEAQKHMRAREQLAALTRMTIPSVVLYELVWVLNRLAVAPEKVLEAVETLVRNPKVAVSPDDGAISVRAIRRVVSEKTALSDFDDKVVLETAMKLGLPLVTYDKELEREMRRAESEAGSRV